MAFDVMRAKAAGYTDQEIQQYLASKNQATVATNPTPQETLPKSGGFDWSSLLPIAGAIGGSFIPGLGNIVGGALGAGAGALLRQGVKNEPMNPGEAVKEAAFAGVGGVGGKLLGGLVGKVLPRSLEGIGTAATASQYNVPRNVARAIKFPESIKTLAEKYGLTGMEDVAKTAEQVTGANGIVSKLTRRAVANAQPVQLGATDTAPSVAEIATNLAANPAISPATETKFINFIQKGITQSMGGEAGNITGTANPSEVFGFAQQLEKAAAGILKGRAPTAITAEDKALANAYNSMAEELKTRLFTHSGADQAVAQGLLTQEELQALQKINPKLAQEIVNAQTVGDLRGVAAPFVQANQAAAETAAGSQYGFQNMGGAKGLGKMVPSLTNPLAPIQMGLSQPEVNAGVGKVALKGAQALRNLPLPNLERAGLATGASMGTGDNVSSNGPMAELMGNNIPSPQVNLASNQPVSANDDAMRKIFFLMMLKNPKQAALLKTMYDFGYPKPPAATADRAASLQSGIGAIDKSLKSVGGFGPITGRAYEVGLKVAGGTGVPDEAVRLETQYNLLRQNIVRAFQGARMSDQDMKIALSYTPSLSDTPRTARLKLQSLKEMMSGLQTELRNSPGTESGSSIPMPSTPTL